MTSLRELPIGKTATIRSVGGEGALRQHFLDMGLIPKGEVTMVKYAPMGDPMELRIHSYELTLRLADAEKIEIENIRDAVEPSEGKAAHKKDISKAIPHPGLGEGGKYHVKENEHPLPDSEILTFALAGNQNCGKTTLFNQLTGSSQHVGNFPGVTVDRKDGNIRGRSNTLVTDLPGIYSMSPYSSEEIVTRNFVLDEHPKGIINIVDATNIERAIKIRRPKSEVIYLTEEELLRLTALYRSGRLEECTQNVLRFFLFLCFTSLHIGDAKALQNSSKKNLMRHMMISI